MKAFAAEFDREFTQARLAEVRALLDSAVVLRTAKRGAPGFQPCGGGVPTAEKPGLRGAAIGGPGTDYEPP